MLLLTFSLIDFTPRFRRKNSNFCYWCCQQCLQRFENERHCIIKASEKEVATRADNSTYAHLAISVNRRQQQLSFYFECGHCHTLYYSILPFDKCVFGHVYSFHVYSFHVSFGRERRLSKPRQWWRRIIETVYIAVKHFENKIDNRRAMLKENIREWVEKDCEKKEYSWKRDYDDMMKELRATK